MTKLTKLEVENFKRIVAISINLGDTVTELSGPNASGKSSTLDAISVLFEGLADAPAVPIRRGAEESVIRGELGELIVERKFKATANGKYTSSITLRTPEGSRYPEPQKHLNQLIGSHMLDPLDFIHMKPAEQFNVLRKFVPDVDFDAIDAANKRDYERRTDVGRFAKEARASASMISVPIDTPEDTVDESALIEAMQKAGEHNAEIEARLIRRERAAEDVKTHTAAAAQSRKEAERLRSEAARAEERAVAEERAALDVQTRIDGAPALPDKIDVTKLRTEIDAARSVNKNVELRARKAKHDGLAKQHEQEWKRLTDEMEARESAKRSAIAEAKIPVPGIEFGDKVILLNGVPFEQASTAEQLRTAFSLIVALNPKLRLAWIRDASLLDDVSLAVIHRLAEEYDCQVLLETVRANSKNAIVLEDGRVKAKDPAEAVA